MSGPAERSGRSGGEAGLVVSAWWMTGSHLLAQAAAYAALIYLARLLSPLDFGTVAVGTALVYVLALAVDRGTYGALVVAAGPTHAELVRASRRCLLAAVLLAVAMAAGAWTLVDMFAGGGAVGAFALLAVCLPLHAVSIVPTAILHRSMQFRRLATVTAVANVGSAAVAVGLGSGGLGVWALAARPLAYFAIVALVATLLCRTELRRIAAASTPTPPHADGVRRTVVDRWFFLFGACLVLTTNLDSLVVGNAGGATLAGLYALAFTVAMAPLTHVAEQVGKVLFAASAADPAGSRERTERSVVVLSMLLLPFVPVGILVAPVALPGLLGPEWSAVVIGFQLLLVAGVGHAIVNCIGEALSGNGHIAFRAKVMVMRCAGTLLALVVLVRIDGVRGAALAQLAVFVPYAAVYATAGARRAGTSARALARRLRVVRNAVTGQLAVTAAAALALHMLGMPAEFVTCLAAGVGFLAVVPLGWRALRSVGVGP